MDATNCKDASLTDQIAEQESNHSWNSTRAVERPDCLNFLAIKKTNLIESDSTPSVFLSKFENVSHSCGNEQKETLKVIKETEVNLINNPTNNNNLKQIIVISIDKRNSPLDLSSSSQHSSSQSSDLAYICRDDCLSELENQSLWKVKLAITLTCSVLWLCMSGILFIIII